MTELAIEAKDVIRGLTFALVAEIQFHYEPDEMAECGMWLVHLYQARAFGPLDDDVERVVSLIEKDLRTIRHYACSGCKALFPDTEDLKPVPVPHICDGETGEPAVGICPVCGSEVSPREPVE